MIIPHRNPRELLMAGEEIQICAVSGQSLAVIVKSDNLSVGKRDTTNALAPTVVSVLVLINIVTEMYYIVNRVLHVSVSQSD